MAETKEFPSEETNVDAEFKQKVNVEYLVLKQIDRCNTAAYEGDEGKFNNAVESLLSMLPKENRQRIESDKNREEYVETIEQPVYQYSCGKPMGSPESPIYRNLPTDWNYRGGEPILVSPTIEEVEQTDYQKLYKLILAELQDVGVTWKVEPRGNTGKKIIPPAMPLIRLRDGKLIRLLVEKGTDAMKENITVEMPLPVPEEVENLEILEEEDKFDEEPDEDWIEKGSENEEEENIPIKKEQVKDENIVLEQPEIIEEKTIEIETQKNNDVSDSLLLTSHETESMPTIKRRGKKSKEVDNVNVN
jgi:hypothetical protein